jgi:hypothetical protein
MVSSNHIRAGQLLDVTFNLTLAQFVPSHLYRCLESGLVDRSSSLRIIISIRKPLWCPGEKMNELRGKEFSEALTKKR